MQADRPPLHPPKIETIASLGRSSVLMDGQTIELVGQHRLASELLKAGLEVAFPARDRGVDLIAYADIDQQARRFVAKPIQMKAASRSSFGIWSKYLRIHDLILAFVWHVNGEGEPRTFALTCAEAITIGDSMGYTRTASWIKHGGYGTTRPSNRLCELLEPYRMDSNAWWLKITGTPRRREHSHTGRRTTTGSTRPARAMEPRC